VAGDRKGWNVQWGCGKGIPSPFGVGSQDERAVPVPENFVIFPRNVMFWYILSHILK